MFNGRLAGVSDYEMLLTAQHSTAQHSTAQHSTASAKAAFCFDVILRPKTHIRLFVLRAGYHRFKTCIGKTT